MKLLNIGSVAFDSIITPFGKISKTLGGSATYFSLSASYFVKPAIVAVVGEDFNSFDILKKRKIDVLGLQKQKGKTFHWAGKYHFDLNTRDTLKTELGVFANFKPILNDVQKSSQYIFLGNIHPALQLDVLKQIKKPKIVGLDTMNLWIETALTDLKKVIAQVNVFVINDSEARQLTKEHNIYKAAKKILAMMNTTHRVLIIKRGEYGLLMFSQNQIFHLPGLPLEEVKDPTGAGDSFAGGMFGYLCKNSSVHTLTLADYKKACIYGSAMASFCIEDFGTKRLHNVKQSEINSRVKQFQQLSKI
jgi:sugar/nucleoside kinase (ribokinase family)